MADITVNGVRLNHLRLGEGDETFVFVHGLVIDTLAAFYFRMAPKVARYAEVVLYDQRGHGRSERPKTGYTVDQQVQDLLGLLDALDIDRPVHLVGHSFGGVFALETAIRHPERVASLFMIDGLYAVEGLAQEMAGNLGNVIFGLGNNDLIAWFEQQQSRKLSRFATNSEELLSKTTLLDDLNRTVPLRIDELESLRCPVVAVYGEQSEAIDLGLTLERHVPNCELHVLPNATHLVLLEASEFVEYYLLEVLGIRGTPPDPEKIVPFDWSTVRPAGSMRAADALEEASRYRERLLDKQ